jgi:hypothetical protein
MHDGLEFWVRAAAPLTFIASLRTEQLTAANGEEAWQAAMVPLRYVSERVCLRMSVLTYTACAQGVMLGSCGMQCLPSRALRSAHSATAPQPQHLHHM